MDRSWGEQVANFVELRYGEVRAGVKVCIAPPRQDPDCASEVCPYSAPSIVCVHTYIKPTAAGVRAREGLGHRDGAERRAGALYQDLGNSDPMIEAGLPSTSGKWKSCVMECCARPTGGSHTRTTRGPAQRLKDAEQRPRCLARR